jgi:hypothetical protein
VYRISWEDGVNNFEKTRARREWDEKAGEVVCYFVRAYTFGGTGLVMRGILGLAGRAILLVVGNFLNVKYAVVHAVWDAMRSELWILIYCVGFPMAT